MTDARNTYRESAARGANPVRLVVLLYEQLAEDLRQAVKAIDDRDIESRTNRINHAILILGYLQSRLDMERGGQVARNLERLYNVFRENFLQAQMQTSKALLLERIADLLSLRDAWSEVERAETAASQEAPSGANLSSSSQQGTTSWKA